MSSKKRPEVSCGNRYGRWTVMNETLLTEKGEKKWLCRCDCGTEKYVLERSLRYGGSESCGCLRKERAFEAKSPDLTGMKFGELTVVKRIEGNKKTGAVKWLCKCSCGADYEVYGSLLVTGKRTRCSGNSHTKNYAYADITGKKFGRLTALYPVRDKKNLSTASMIWRCKCDCGNEADVSYNNLMYANQKSCGCQKKEHDKKLSTLLTHVASTSIESVRSKKIPKDNTTGYKGVYFIRGKYVAKIVFQKKPYYLGTFDNIEDAAEARKEAEEILFDAVSEHYRKWKARADVDDIWAEENPFQVIVTQRDDKKLSVILLPELAEQKNIKKSIINAVS